MRVFERELCMQGFRVFSRAGWGVLMIIVIIIIPTPIFETLENDRKFSHHLPRSNVLIHLSGGGDKGGG